MDEFMKRRYEFRYNALTTEVEYRERHSFNFYFRPVDKRVLASITMNAMCEGVKMWDRDVIRYLDSDHVPIYHPVEDFLYHLPRWDGKDRILELANRVPCDNPHWAPLFRRWFLSMIAHWMGMDKKTCEQHFAFADWPAGIPEVHFLQNASSSCFTGVLYGQH